MIQTVSYTTLRDTIVPPSDPDADRRREWLIANGSRGATRSANSQTVRSRPQAPPPFSLANRRERVVAQSNREVERLGRDRAVAARPNEDL